MLSTFERRRAKPSPHSRASAQRLGSAVYGGAAACCTWQSTRVARRPRGRRIRHLAGGDAEPEQRRLRFRPSFTAACDIHILLLSSLDRQEEHHRAHTRLACGGAGQRWFFLRQSWLGSSPLTQRNHSPPPSRQPRCRRRHHRRRGLWLRSVLHMAPCTTAIDSVVKGHAFVVCERRLPPSSDGGDGRHSRRCESRSCRCSRAAPSSLPPQQSLPPVCHLCFCTVRSVCCVHGLYLVQCASTDCEYR